MAGLREGLDSRNHSRTADAIAIAIAGARRSGVDAHLHKPPAGRPGAVILEMKDLGDNVFYGG